MEPTGRCKHAAATTIWLSPSQSLHGKRSVRRFKSSSFPTVSSNGGHGSTKPAFAHDD